MKSVPEVNELLSASTYCRFVLLSLFTFGESRHSIPPFLFTDCEIGESDRSIISQSEMTLLHLQLKRDQTRFSEESSQIGTATKKPDDKKNATGRMSEG